MDAEIADDGVGILIVDEQVNRIRINGVAARDPHVRGDIAVNFGIQLPAFMGHLHIASVEKIAVFVDGCFWHGHDCRNTRPSDNADYWTKKRERNIKHDKEITELFKQRGWTVIRIWECELKKMNRELLLEKLKILQE